MKKTECIINKMRVLSVIVCLTLILSACGSKDNNQDIQAANTVSEQTNEDKDNEIPIAEPEEQFADSVSEKTENEFNEELREHLLMACTQVLENENGSYLNWQEFLDNLSNAKEWLDNNIKKLKPYRLSGKQIKSIIPGKWNIYSEGAPSIPYIETILKDGICYSDKKYKYKWKVKNDRYICFLEDDIVFSFYNDNVLALFEKKYDRKKRKYKGYTFDYIMVRKGFDFETAGSIPNPIVRHSRPEPYIGMTAAEVRSSSWGSHSDINRTETTYGTHEQWCYSNNRYIYLDDGIVTAIQS